MNQILKKNYHYILLFVITIILFSYIIGTNNIVGADTRFHFANIEAYLIKIVSLNTTPKLLPIIGNNYLYGTPIFYGSFPHLLTAILASIFYLFNVSYPILLAMKIFYILVFYLSSLIMYNWIKSVSKNKIVSLIGAVFYLTLPFKLWDVYIRDGYTEIFTFLFIPMVFYGLHLLLDKNDKNKFYIYFVIGFSGLLLSHLITTFFVIIATLIYLFMEYKKVLNKKVVITLVKSSIIIIGITAIYWIPFIQHYILGNYRIFNDTGLDLKAMFLNSTITLKQLFLINKIPGGKQFFIPIVIVLSFFYVIINYRRIETGKKNVFIAIIICLIFICFVTIKPLLYLIPKQLYSIQYLFRALIVPLCFLCFSSSFVFLFITGNKKNILAIVFIVFSVFISFYSIDDVYVTKYNVYNENISISGMGWQKEYLPVNSFELFNENKYNFNENDIVFLKDNGEINLIERDFDYFEFDIRTDNKDFQIELPCYYYIGYDAYQVINDKRIKLETFASDNGLLSIKGNQNGRIIVKYKGSPISYLITIISVISFLIILKRGK